MLNWANQFNIFCFLDSHSYAQQPASFDYILAAGSLQRISLSEPGAFEHLQKVHESSPCWLFGHLGYELKNQSFPSYNNKPDRIGFGKGHFFEPEFILRVKNNIVEILSHHMPCEKIFNLVNDSKVVVEKIFVNPVIQQGMSKDKYLQTIETLRSHIQRGDCYEINYCQEFFANDTHLDPIKIYHELSGISPNPFAALYKLDDKYCICQSPERYLKKEGSKVFSQPIKGTVARNDNNSESDLKNKNFLQNSPKEKAENVMIVDLVRNDLSRVCLEGSVEVEELFGIYAFPHLYQMISTIKGSLPPDMAFTEVIKASFPIGSMTGAPKHKVLQLIDKYEQAGRGLFSGSIGYITPGADFDFNVVIRSIFYNSSKSCISFWAGSAITFYSKAEDEYNECMLKAKAIIKVLES
ncbi:MAG: anthranilate synthase component I family protein [Ferruginibacter sp.]